MKYYLIAGEASGDLHASHLMQALKRADAQASFRFFGGDLMASVGGTRVRHYRELAYMGFVPVLLHLPTILRNMRQCKRDIAQWRPDVVILVDYPGFNLSIAKHVRQQGLCPVYYYIAPKLWAWKEYRIKNIKRDVAQLFSILPFEKEFFEQKHHYPMHYVGNPTAAEVADFRAAYHEQRADFLARHGIGGSQPVIALLAGSRKQEIKDNLPAMIEAARSLPGYQLLLAGAPGIDEAFYQQYLAGQPVRLVRNDTFALLSHAHAAVVTSGTATLETALFGVPQVVCYETPLPRIVGYLRKRVLSVPYISLVNLIAGRSVVPELVADSFSVSNIRTHLAAILDGPQREAMLSGYADMAQRLGNRRAPDEAAAIITGLLGTGKAGHSPSTPN